MGVKSLNIYGVQDQHLGTPDEMKERTLKLASMYEDPEILEHGGGHFTPQWWPWDKIQKFILDNGIPLETSPEGAMKDDATMPIMERLDALTRYWEYHVGDERVLPSFNTPELQDLTGTCPKDVVSDITALFDKLCTGSPTPAILDDLMVLTTFFHHRFYKNPTHTTFRDMLSKLAITSPDYITTHFPLIIKFGHWRSLNDLILDNHAYIDPTTLHLDRAQQIHQALLTLYSTQLQRDATIIATQSASHTGEEGEGTDFSPLSLLALYVPRINGAIDSKTHFSRDLAKSLRPGADKLTAYVGFQKLYRSICLVLENSAPDRATSGYARQMEEMPKLSVEQRKTFLALPPNLFVSMPEEVPVAPCPLADLKPLMNYLTSNSPLPKENVKFVRGIVVPVVLSTGEKGVVDLCKQVVGPEGVVPLLKSLMQCKRVEGLLLGNNITGSKGAREIAKCIRREDNQITTWYLGGNQFTAEDIEVIAKALERDDKVYALWLKRNPVLPEGALSLGRMLAVNSTLTTLDLSNCGILDEGCRVLFEDGMMRNHTMKHLYLNTNGITVAGCVVIARYFDAGGELESLYMSCNPIGDEGTEILAKALKGKYNTIRLGLASCAIGEAGINALCHVFPTLPNLEYLNLGFIKGTYIFNGLPNYLGLNGITKLCNTLSYMPSLRYLDINHNQIPAEGLQLLLDSLRALPEGQGLTALTCGQFGQERSEIVEAQLREVTLRNAMLWGKRAVGGMDEMEWKRVGFEFSERAVCPDHVKEIMSVTRNMDV
jgi:Ran GTPase-activating protein (RanGAP) involved in mRNA processing and transport